MSRSRKAILFGLFVGAFGIVLRPTPVGVKLEETVGLSLLFRLRGPIEAPSEVVVVSIDRSAARNLGLASATLSEWPRAKHAQLIDELVMHDVSVIVLDLTFSRPRSSEEDDLLASAIARANRVVLVEKAFQERPGNSFLVRLEAPIPQFADAAVGLGPNPVPRDPVRVHQCWAFKDLGGEVPTLPLVALQIHGFQVLDHLVALLKPTEFGQRDFLPQGRTEIRNAEDLRELMISLRRKLKEDPQIRERLFSTPAVEAQEGMSQQERELLTALVKLYTGDHSYYLNFYGPPGTIKTIPYDRLLSAADPADSQKDLDLAGKVVFVGASELSSTEQLDDFYTIFRREDSVDIQGVEIAATAFANFLNDRTLRYHTGLDLGLVMLFGALVGTLAYLAPAALAVVACMGIAVLYFGLGQFLFTNHDLWIPLFVPLLLELPLALFLGLCCQYCATRRQRENLRPYVPERLAELVDKRAVPTPERVFGTCLSTDIEGYTQVVRDLDSEQLESLMSRYYGRLFQPVREHEGFVQDFAEGDNTMCVWTAKQPEKRVRFQACVAALEIRKEMDQFNQRYADQHLPTRIGLHSGWGKLGNVGPSDRLAFRFIGEVPTTALLIQRLNKLLSTRILASETAAGDLDSLLLRHLGSFILVGNPDPLPIFEVMGLQEDRTEGDQDLCGRFQGALEAFEAQRWSEVVEICQLILDTYPEDGPSRFYLERCRHYCAGKLRSGEGAAIRIDTK